MENDPRYFTTTLPESFSEIDGELTILVDEGGEMVLDITQTLSNFVDQNREGSLVIITTDESSSQLGNSTIAYNLSQENACENSFQLQTTDDFVDDSHLPMIPPQVPTAVSDLNKDQTQFFLPSNTPSDVSNYVSPVYITGEGQTLFVMESSLQGASSQVITIDSQTNFTEENHGCDTTGTKIRRLLPKPPISNSSDIQPNTLAAIGQKKRLKKVSTLNYEICPMNPDVVVTTGDGPTAQKIFVCDKCPTEEPMKFARFEELSRHYGKIHHLRLVKNASVYCREENCPFKSWRVDDLRKHLTMVHGFQMEAQTHNFTSMEDFMEWKTSEEKSSGSKFNRSSGDQQIRRSDNQKVSVVYTYYACNRSGTKRIRACKESGKTKKSNRPESIKMNGTCTASIRLIHDKVLNRISCDYCPTHYGHDIKEPHRQNLSKQEKDWMLQLLRRGWNSDEIVKTLRNGTITGTSIRMMSVTRQDVFNVYRSHGVANFERRDPDDKTSVKLWVDELRSKSSVLIWNPEDNVLLLAVMNENQTVLARIHSRIVYVTDISFTWDRHHRLIALSALSTADDEAYLLAYALTDQVGLEALQAVFAAVQAKLGQTFQPEFVFSQDPSRVADAWIPGTDSFPIFLCPPWNVEKEWDEGRVKYIDNDLKREAVKKSLDILLAESDPLKFSTFLQLVNGMLNADESLHQFSQFFVTSYAQQAAHWPRFHPLPDCSSLQRLNVELELIARRCRALKRLDKCIYSLEFLASNQPYQPMTEFRCSSTQKESQEVCNLRRAIAEQMKTLERVAHECDNLDALKRINGAIRQALE